MTFVIGDEPVSTFDFENGRALRATFPLASEQRLFGAATASGTKSRYKTPNRLPMRQQPRP
jgi:hypothetical protein